ncbi:helix-turn-helix domain-containing protein [Candidatus Halocynthiibacter alkanivorans]|uniref:helix-turn-helix domain-containing protein n=1 Tax=Candidatus Halocynthiibacter alkanivorans TaxID=2267619 RepID=UPI0013581A2A|nr:helix-turn-helix domain-containing protein [Candidatus Halocynthiibacter alkanivorans]
MSHKATNWLSQIEATDLGNSEFRVLFHLCDCHNPSQGCFPTQGYLIAATGVSNGTLNNALNSLERKGLIQRHQSWDNKTKRQRPTRYLLGFEIAKDAEPSPKTGVGNVAKPTPKTGDGADSNKHPDPSPKNRKSRLQPTGEEPVKEPVINRPRASGRKKNQMERGSPETFWAGKVKSGSFVPPSAIKPNLARRMLAQELVSEADLRDRGISF